MGSGGGIAAGEAASLAMARPREPPNPDHVPPASPAGLLAKPVCQPTARVKWYLPAFPAKLSSHEPLRSQPAKQAAGRQEWRAGEGLEGQGVRGHCRSANCKSARKCAGKSTGKARGRANQPGKEACHRPVPSYTRAFLPLFPSKLAGPRGLGFQA